MRRRSRPGRISWPVCVQVSNPTPRPQVVVQPPPDGIDYESAVLRNIYEQVGPSVVNITVEMNHPAVSGSDTVPSDLEITSSGSGFVWDTDGHIVTNYHVVEGADQVQVTFSDGTMSIADVVGEDEDSDLAVIKIDPDRLRPCAGAAGQHGRCVRRNACGGDRQPVRAAGYA